VLDSVVPPDGPEPFAIASFQAIGPAMSELCASRACAGITHDALRDLARLAARLRRHGLTGSAYDGRGHRHSVSLGELDLLLILEVGDVNPAMRALLPAAVHAALAGDPDPLLRLNLLAEGFIPNVPTQPPAEAEQAADEGNALFTATSCEETHFPWQRTAPAATRHAEALAALHAVPAGVFSPFDPTTALHAGRILECEGWPDVSPPPAPRGTLPAVPALLLSGAQDLRTPTFNAREVAAQIPGAQVLVVPHTGHSVLGSDFSGCAETAVASFFAAATVQPCPASKNLFAPTPVPPRRLGQVHTPPGLPGRAGRTLTAVVDAIVDLDRQVIAATLQAEQELPSGSSFGGLRGGYAKLTSSAAILKRFAFISGVALSGRFPVRDGQLQPATIRISGAHAAHGTVTFSLRRHVTGRLGGRRFDVSLARVRLSSASPPLQWPSHPLAFPLAGLVDRPKLAGR
jgi:pimeloyl-ACP methyl ester carboxylesterase